MFSPDSKFSQAMSRVGDLIILNVLFLLTSIPIFTIGASASAMYTVTSRLGTEKEGKLAKTYFSAFKENFKQATVLWLFLLLGLAGSACSAILLYEKDGYAFVIFVVIFILVLMTASYTFPLVSRFQNDILTTLKNGLLLSVGYFPRTVVMVILNVLPIAVLVVSPTAFFQFLILWLGVYFAAAAMVNTCLLRKVFAPYLPEVPEE